MSEIMILDYEFKKDDNIYDGIGIDIGESCEIAKQAKDIKGLKISAICHAFDLTIDEFEKQNIDIDDYNFKYCELRIEE